MAEIRRENQLRLVVDPIIYGGFYTFQVVQALFLTSTSSTVLRPYFQQEGGIWGVPWKIPMMFCSLSLISPQPKKQLGLIHGFVLRQNKSFGVSPRKKNRPLQTCPFFSRKLPGNSL